MNRRQFLKVLAFMGIALAIPIPPIIATVIGSSLTTGIMSISGVSFLPETVFCFFDDIELVSMDVDGFTLRPIWRPIQ